MFNRIWECQSVTMTRIKKKTNSDFWQRLKWSKAEMFNIWTPNQCPLTFLCSNRFELGLILVVFDSQTDSLYRLQWSWWRGFVGDFMMVTVFRCWCQSHCVGDCFTQYDDNNMNNVTITDEHLYNIYTFLHFKRMEISKRLSMKQPVSLVREFMISIILT